MRIDRIRIRGYKSIRDVSFSPHALSVLIGPNNAGKSNILDAISFISDLYGKSSKISIDRKGGFENIANRDNGRPVNEISFDITASGSLSEMAHRRYRDEDKQDRIIINHSFTLRGRGQKLIADFFIASESLTVSLEMSNTNPPFIATRQNGEVRARWGKNEEERKLIASYFPTDEIKFLTRMIESSSSREELITESTKRFIPAIEKYVGYLSKIRIYQLAPNECRKNASPTPFADLEIHGANLPALVYHLKESSPKQWSNVMEKMFHIFPALERIEVEPTHDRLWSLRFKERLGNQEWNTNEVSDGTIRALAMLATIYDDRSSLLSIEEPENALHPWITRTIIDACLSVTRKSKDRQILLTTHSPIVIEHLDPHDIMVVWKQSNETRLSSLSALDSEAIGLWKQGDLSLFDLLDSGHLIEAVPGLRS